MRSKSSWLQCQGSGKIITPGFLYVLRKSFITLDFTGPGPLGEEQNGKAWGGHRMLLARKLRHSLNYTEDLVGAEGGRKDGKLEDMSPQE